MTQIFNDRQCTVAKDIFLEGVGLHTGKKVSLTIKPAPVSKGICFIRTDLKDKPKIFADSSFVTETMRGTTLGNGDATVSTVEHLLASLWGMGIDNAYLEISGEEVPILDGSAFPFCSELMKTGVTVQDKPRKYLNLTEPVFLKKEDMSIVALPHNGLKISFTIEYDHPYISQQSRSYTYSLDTFVQDISKARTFCFDHELDLLRKQDLIKGGDLSNGIVITKDGILNEKLLFEDEFVRHKILDMIGDLALLGLRLNAHVIALKSGHAFNINFVKRLKKSLLVNPSSRDFLDPIPGDMIVPGQTLTVDDIKKIIPHRYPFLLVDRIIETNGVNKATGIKNFTINEHFFEGHFPGHPIVPGVLIVESLAQTAACLLLAKLGNHSKVAYFMSLDHVKFRKPVLPGDSLILKIEILRVRSKIVVVDGQAYVDEDLVAEGQFKFALVDGN